MTILTMIRKAFSTARVQIHRVVREFSPPSEGRALARPKSCLEKRRLSATEVTLITASSCCVAVLCALLGGWTPALLAASPQALPGSGQGTVRLEAEQQRKEGDVFLADG